MVSLIFDLQGHRGARGQKPENTLPSFEAALDAGATTIETDLHLTRDGVPVLIHDSVLNDKTYRLRPESTPPDTDSRSVVAELTLAQLRRYRADGNPDPARFPDQEASVPPVTQLFAERHGLDPYAIPTLANLFAFAAAYAGELGQAAGNSSGQQARARRVRFDLELKRIPYLPEAIGDDYTGAAPDLLEKYVVEIVRQAGVLDRTIVRSFDHRSLAFVRRLEPVTTAILVADTAPLHPGKWAHAVGAEIYCPRYWFVDPDLIRRAHADGVRVVPWTVNDRADWDKLIAWGVDGLTTDYPLRLAEYLTSRGIPF